MSVKTPYPTNTTGMIHQIQDFFDGKRYLHLDFLRYPDENFTIRRNTLMPTPDDRIRFETHGIGIKNPSLSPIVGAITIASDKLRFDREKTELWENFFVFPKEAQRELGEAYVSRVKREHLIREKAIVEILQHPVAYARLYVRSVLLTLTLPNTNFLANSLGILKKPTGLIADMRVRTISQNVRALWTFRSDYLAGSADQTLFLVALVAELLVMFATYILAFVGIVHGLKGERRLPVLLLLMICAYFIIIAGPIGTGRYRLPAMPYLMMLAGYGCIQLRNWLRADAIEEHS